MLPEAVHVCIRSVMWLVFCLATRNVKHICKLVWLVGFCFITQRMFDLHEAAHLTDSLFFSCLRISLAYTAEKQTKFSVISLKTEVLFPSKINLSTILEQTLYFNLSLFSDTGFSRGQRKRFIKVIAHLFFQKHIRRLMLCQRK